MNKNTSNKKGVIPLPMPIIIMAVVIVIVIALTTLTTNANGISNWFHKDVESFTPVAPGCSPKMYLVEMHGTLDLINDFLGFSGYEIHYIDAHINDITLSKLGVLNPFDNNFESEICLEDMNGKSLMCESIKDDVTKGSVEKFPFTFKYNLPDNDCNGKVDDHTFNIRTRLMTDDGYEENQKTVAIVNGKAVYQNVEYDGAGRIDWCKLYYIHPATVMFGILCDRNS
ncbi:hypothetical protein ACFL43_04165 [Thermodesulfobacteriota bacterium]